MWWANWFGALMFVGSPVEMALTVDQNLTVALTPVENVVIEMEPA